MALLAPAVLLVVAFVLMPTAMAIIDSFDHEGQWTFANYATIALSGPYPQVFLNTILISLSVTLASLAIAAPAAAFLVAQPGRLPRLLLGAVGASLWISLLVKVYAWQVLLARGGPINQALMAAGLIGGPAPLLYTRGAVLSSMIQFMVPYACMLLAAGMRRIDWDLIVAARTLGAGVATVFREVYWPQVRVTVVMTGLIVFVISTSFFVAPALLGGPHDIMLGMQMQSDLINQYDSGLAATTGTALTLVLLITAWIAVKLSGAPFHRLADELAQ